MSLISNVSSRVGNSQVVNSARNFLNTPAKKVIVIVAVAVIIALGLYLLGRCCPCRRRFSAKSANSPTNPTIRPRNPTSRPADPAPNPSIPLTSQTTQTATNRTISTDPASVPDALFNNDGQLLGASHFQQYSQGEMTGWLSIFAHRRIATFYPDNGAPKQDIVNLGCLNQAHWITADSVRSHRGLVNFNTDPNSVPDVVFTTGENGGNIHGITHYRQLQNGQGEHYGWLLISETKKNAVAHIDGRFFVWAFPTEQTGWINADDVRRCKRPSQPQPLPDSSSQSGQPELELSGDRSVPTGPNSALESSPSTDQPAPTGPNPALESSPSTDQQATSVQDSAPNGASADSSAHSTEWFESSGIKWNARENGYEEATVQHEGRTIQLLREEGLSVWEKQGPGKWTCLKQADANHLTATSRDRRKQPAELLTSLATENQTDSQDVVSTQLDRVRRSAGNLPGLSSISASALTED